MHTCTTLQPPRKHARDKQRRNGSHETSLSRKETRRRRRTKKKDLDGGHFSRAKFPPKPDREWVNFTTPSHKAHSDALSVHFRCGFRSKTRHYQRNLSRANLHQHRPSRAVSRILNEALLDSRELLARARARGAKVEHIAQRMRKGVDV